MQEWEYAVRWWPCPPEDQEIHLAQMGQEGWELVSVNSPDGYRFFFKRPAQGVR